LGIRNKTLYAKVRELILASVELLKNIDMKEDLPTRPTTVYSFDETGAQACMQCIGPRGKSPRPHHKESGIFTLGLTDSES